MRFRSNLQYENGLRPVYVVPSVTLAFILVLLGVLGPRFCSFPGLQVEPLRPAVLPDSRTLEIVLADDSSCSINGSPVTQSQLVSLLAQISSRDPQILIKASRKTPLEAAVELWRLCGKTGIKRVSLVTD